MAGVAGVLFDPNGDDDSSPPMVSRALIRSLIAFVAAGFHLIVANGCCDSTGTTMLDLESAASACDAVDTPGGGANRCMTTNCRQEEEEKREREAECVEGNERVPSGSFRVYGLVCIDIW